MTNKTTLILFIILAHFKMNAQSSYSLAEQNKIKKNRIDSVANGVIIPNFLLRTTSGESIQFSSLLGQTVVVDIWATWCSPCIKQIPYYDSLSMGNDHIEFISISIDSDFDKWSAYCTGKTSSVKQFWIGDNDESPVKWLTYELIQTDSLERLVSSIPRFVIINSDGTIKNNNSGMPSTGQLLKEILK